MPLPFGAPDPTFPVSDYLLPATTLNVVYNGVNITSSVAGYSISGGRGQPVQGEVTIRSNNNGLVDVVSAFNQTNSSIRAHNMSASRGLTITVTQGSVSTAYPSLIPGDPSWDNEGTLSFSFTDRTPLLDKDNQNIPDAIHEEGDIETSHTMLAEIASMSGVTITPTFSSYPIRTFRGATKNFLAAIDELCFPRQAYRKWVGTQLFLEKLVEGSPSRTLVDRLHIPEGGLTLTKDTSGVKTRFNYFRDVPLSTILARASCTGTLLAESPCVGRVVQLSFNRPAIAARVFWSATNGVIQDGVFFDEGDVPLNSAPSEIFYGTPTSKAVRWLGTYVPNFILGGDGEYIPSWEAWADSPPLTSTSGGSFESNKIVSVLEGLYGQRPEYRNMESELLLESTDAQYLLDAIELELLWSTRQFSLNTPFLLNQREGDFIGLTHYAHGLNNTTCLIDSWNHSFSWENGWNNSYELRAKTT